MFLCPLCKDTVSNVIDSHLLPRAAYKHVAPNGTKMMRVSSQNDAFYSAKQESIPLLCKDCEKRFSDKGEAPVGRLWSTRAGFPLLEKLRNSRQIFDGMYDGNCLSHVDRSALVYFPASVIWRSSIWPHNVAGHKGTLGRKYEENFRSFLMGDSDLEKVKILVRINNSPKPSDAQLMSLPSFTKDMGGRRHEFHLLGLHFNLIVGQSSEAFDSVFDELSSNLLLMTENIKDAMWYKGFVKKANTEITMRGRLAKDYPKHSRP